MVYTIHREKCILFVSGGPDFLCTTPLSVKKKASPKIFGGNRVIDFNYLHVSNRTEMQLCSQCTFFNFHVKFPDCINIIYSILCWLVVVVVIVVVYTPSHSSTQFARRSYSPFLSLSLALYLYFVCIQSSLKCAMFYSIYACESVHRNARKRLSWTLGARFSSLK